ncbi:MAG TPA: lysylphosphatidylglycerol synthase transmembrane domain-containing protein [Longimicrobiales bacterium]|nr:lysylphosphatidylglycerol synthase transmembrane domain-containing protein [Longimicrobiales bacterium]
MSAPKSKRSYFDWKAVVGIVLSVVLLWWALREVDPHTVLAEIRHADPLYFAGAVFCATFVFWIRAWRWKTLLTTAAPESTFRSRLAATTIGFMGNNLLPARVGEFARAYAFAKLERITVVASLGSLVVERLFDAIGIIGLLFFTLALPDVPTMGPKLNAIARTLGVFIVVGLVVGVALVLFPQRTVKFIEDHLARFLPMSIRRPVVDSLEAFLSGLTVLRSPWLLIVATVQTLILWVFNALGFWLGFKTFGIEVPFSAALLLQSVIALAVSIPSSPGFFGPFEAAAKTVLVGAYGLTADKAVSFAIGFHIGGFVPVTVIGLYYAWRLGISMKEVAHSEETVEDEVEKTL